MTYRVPDPVTLLADIRDQSRRALAERLLARVPGDVRNQLVYPVNQYVRNLNETQIAMQHILLDHQEAPHA